MKELQTATTVIRQFRKEDVEQVYQMFKPRKNPEKFENIVFYSLLETKDIVNSSIQEFNTDETIWAIEERKENRFIGNIKIQSVSKTNNTCEISWIIDDEEQIYSKEVILKVLQFLFEEKGYRIVTTQYYSSNDNKADLADKVGMIKEAVLKERKINLKTGETEDLIISSMNKERFQELYKIGVNEFEIRLN